MPVQKEYLSENHKYKLIVTPSEYFSRPVSFWEILFGSLWIFKPSHSQLPCVAQLYQLDQNSHFKLVWKKNLKNECTPVHALASNDGENVVTIDDWGSIGEGENVVVIYGKEGEFIKSYSLKDILAIKTVKDEIPDEKNIYSYQYSSYFFPPENSSSTQNVQFVRSITSTFWGNGHYIDNKNHKLVLLVVKNNEFPLSEKAQFIVKEIPLKQ